MVTNWVLAVATGLALLHLLATAYTLGWSSGRGRRSSTESDALHCPSCGVANKPDYRYCRHCVSKLQTGVSVAESREDGRSRRTL
jgi:hypothetical protein